VAVHLGYVDFLGEGAGSGEKECRGEQSGCRQFVATDMVRKELHLYYLQRSDLDNTHATIRVASGL
jgi:hypothetical protein